MSNKKVILIVSSVIFLACAFIISFNWGMNKFDKSKNGKINSADQAGVDNVTSVLKAQETISPNAKVTLKIQYVKAAKTDEKEMKASEFPGKTKKELEDSGYTIENFTQSEVVLSRKIDSYEPNKYVLGVKNDCLAIYKTDNEGNMYIEDESTDITDIEVPTKSDYDLLEKGSKYLQFDSKEEAEEKLGEYSS